MKHLEVVAAIIQKEGKILCVQRGESAFPYTSKKWEFAGGKVEAGETDEEALIREIAEELALTIAVERHYYTVEHHYPDFSITMRCYQCHIVSGELQLHEHLSSKWLNPQELTTLDWAAADIPVVEKLISLAT